MAIEKVWFSDARCLPFLSIIIWFFDYDENRAKADDKTSRKQWYIGVNYLYNKLTHVHWLRFEDNEI